MSTYQQGRQPPVWKGDTAEVPFCCLQNDAGVTENIRGTVT